MKEDFKTDIKLIINTLNELYNNVATHEAEIVVTNLIDNLKLQKGEWKNG